MAEIFDIGLETDLSEFTSTVTDGDDLSQSGAAALAGTSGGLSCLIDDINPIYGRKDYTQLTGTTYRFRFYIDPNGLTMASGNSFPCCSINRTAVYRIGVFLRHSGTSYQIYARALNDAGTSEYTEFYDITDAPHYVETRLIYATSAVSSDATVDLWIDGVHKEEMGGMDIYDRSKPDQAVLGAWKSIDYPGTQGTFYLDEFILRDDGNEIGPTGTIVAPSAVTMVMATVDPTVLESAITPSPATMVMATIDPTVVAGSIVVTPSPVTAVFDTTGPQIIVPLVLSQLDPAGEHTQIASVGDILQLKGLADGIVREMWAEVDSVVDQTTYFDYNISVLDGPAAAFPAGSTFINYGVSGEGVIRSISDETYQPYIEALTHAGSPYSTVTRHSVFGKLQEFTGVDEWGLAVGADLDAFSDDYIVFSDGRFLVNTDLNIATGKGFQFADGGVAGHVLTDDGTGLFLPAAGGGGGIDLTPTEGAIIYGSSVPDWAVLAHPGSAYQHLETSASGLSWQTRITLTTDVATETAVHITDDGGISATGSLIALIDANNDTSTAIFEIAKDADSREDGVSGTHLWYITEAQEIVMRGESVSHGNDYVFKHGDVWSQIECRDTASGGMLITGGKDGDGPIAGEALLLRGMLDENADTTTSTAGHAIVEIHAGQGSGGPGWDNVVSSGNVFGIRAYKNASLETILLLNEDGDLWISGALDVSGVSIQLQMDTSDVTDSGPTDAEVDAIFGTPSSVGAGFLAFIDDDNLSERIFGVVSDGTRWWWQRWFLCE